MGVKLEMATASAFSLESLQHSVTFQFGNTPTPCNTLTLQCSNTSLQWTQGGGRIIWSRIRVPDSPLLSFIELFIALSETVVSIRLVNPLNGLSGPMESTESAAIWMTRGLGEEFLPTGGSLPNCIKVRVRLRVIECKPLDAGYLNAHSNSSITKKITRDSSSWTMLNVFMNFSYPQTSLHLAASSRMTPSPLWGKAVRSKLPISRYKWVHKWVHKFIQGSLAACNPLKARPFNPIRSGGAAWMSERFSWVLLTASRKRKSEKKRNKECRKCFKEFY